MSYNRGNMRRGDGRRSNDFGGNRRGGVGGGFHNNYDNFSRPMNPWEGGMVPGRGGNSGLLPNPSQGGGGDLLSQLTSPEAQLALASNLINKLISQQQQNTPSLINLGNLGTGGGHMPSFNDGFGNRNNFQDRRRGRMDQRRIEPYNKSAMNRRGTGAMGNDRRNLNKNRMGSDRTGPDRKPFVSKSPKVVKEEKDKKDTEKANGDIKTEPSDEPKREEDKESDEAKDKEVKEKSSIPPALLYCHVCCKNMWDEMSFSKHLKGRPHQLMMDGLSEKYKLKVDLLRHEMRLADKQREMELERRQRQGMKMFNHPREFCAMCDLRFFGNLISHRKNIRHQKLKNFLHPKCSHCSKEFSTRLEWDEHRLTFTHLEKVAEFRRATKPDIPDDEFDIDELVCPDIVNCGEMVSKEVPLITSHHSEDDSTVELKEEPLKEKDKDGDDKKEESEEAKAADIKAKEDEYPQGIDIEPAKIPKYNPALRIGKDLVIEVSGHMCRVCNRFIPSEEETAVHCRTLSHYNNYCNIVRAKARVTRKNKPPVKTKEEIEKEETKVVVKAEPDTSKLDSSLLNGCTVHLQRCNGSTQGDGGASADEEELSETTEEQDDDEGNWKRRKVNEKPEKESEEKMDVDPSDVKQEDKDEISDSVWEESEEATKEEEEEEEVEEETQTRRPQKAVRGGPRGRRGGKRGK